MWPLNSNDPAKWRTNVGTYAHLKYGKVHLGVDLIYPQQSPAT